MKLKLFMWLIVLEWALQTQYQGRNLRKDDSKRDPLSPLPVGCLHAFVFVYLWWPVWVLQKWSFCPGESSWGLLLPERRDDLSSCHSVRWLPNFFSVFLRAARCSPVLACQAEPHQVLWISPSLPAGRFSPAASGGAQSPTDLCLFQGFLFLISAICSLRWARWVLSTVLLASSFCGCPQALWRRYSRVWGLHKSQRAAASGFEQLSKCCGPLLFNTDF